MTLRALRYYRLSVLCVLGSCHHTEMFRIHASTYAADVVYLFIGRNSTMLQFVSNPMGTNRVPVKPEVTVSSTIDTAYPQAAT